MALSSRRPDPGEQAFDRKMDALLELSKDNPGRAFLDGLLMLREIYVDLVRHHVKLLTMNPSPRQRTRAEGAVGHWSRSIGALDKSIVRLKKWLKL